MSLITKLDYPFIAVVLFFITKANTMQLQKIPAPYSDPTGNKNPSSESLSEPIMAVKTSGAPFPSAMNVSPAKVFDIFIFEQICFRDG